MLRQFHLKLAFPRVGMAPEHIKDQGGAVDDLDFQGILQGPLLVGVQLIVADNRARMGLKDEVLKLGELARAEVVPFGAGQILAYAGHYLSPSSTGQHGKLVQRFFQFPRLSSAPDAHTY